MANDRPTLYTGVTSNILKRVDEHKKGIGSNFTSRYHLTKLVYFEYVEDIAMAIAREKQIKDMDRIDKLALIRTINPRFVDLFPQLRKSM